VTPTVSVCVATRNDGAWLEEALASVEAQTYADLEVIVVDDASTDATADVLGARVGPRFVAVRNDRNLGEARSMNRAFSLARGRYVKPLHGDDVLAPDCVEHMLTLGARDGVGLFFSLRHVLVAPGDHEAERWARRYGRIHERLGRLDTLNSGREIFRRYLEVGLLKNCLAEPSGVLIERRALERVGGLHLHMVGHLDVDLLMRIAGHYDVAFADEPLFAYRRHGASASSRRVAQRLDFLDRVWSLEGLRRDPELWAAEPKLAELHARELRQAVRRAPAELRLGPRRWKLERYARLAAAVGSARAGRPYPLHGAVPPVEWAGGAT